MNYIIIEGPTGKREVPETDELGESKPFKLAPGEKVVGSRTEQNEDIGLGDLITAITTSTGFKQWWEGGHDNPCGGCERRAAAANYIRFKGPEWLKTWIAENVKHPLTAKIEEV